MYLIKNSPAPLVGSLICPLPHNNGRRMVAQSPCLAPKVGSPSKDHTIFMNFEENSVIFYYTR